MKSVVSGFKTVSPVPSQTMVLYLQISILFKDFYGSKLTFVGKIPSV